MMDADVMERPRTDLRDMFVPVIFANGEDDDTPGFVAAVEDRAVMFDDRVYQPGENITVDRRVLIFTKGLHIIEPDFESVIPTPPGYIRIAVKTGVRDVLFMYCTIIFKEGGLIMEGKRRED